MARRVKASVEILGVYAHVPPSSAVRAYAKVLADMPKARRVAAARAALSRAVLVEALVHHPTKSFEFEFGQGGTGMNSFAWDPRVLTLDGQAVVGREAPRRCEACRVTAWIHDYSASKPIRTEYGVVKAPPVTAMPARLKKLVPYEVVD